MTDDEFEKALDDLNGMLKSLRRITDKGRRDWLKNIIRRELNKMMKK